MMLLSDLIRCAWVVTEKYMAESAFLVGSDSRCIPTRKFSQERGSRKKEEKE
jgi:hypothetical protein